MNVQKTNNHGLSMYIKKKKKKKVEKCSKLNESRQK